MEDVGETNSSSVPTKKLQSPLFKKANLWIIALAFTCFLIIAHLVVSHFRSSSTFSLQSLPYFPFSPDSNEDGHDYSLNNQDSILSSPEKNSNDVSNDSCSMTYSLSTPLAPSLLRITVTCSLSQHQRWLTNRAGRCNTTLDLIFTSLANRKETSTTKVVALHCTSTYLIFTKQITKPGWYGVSLPSLNITKKTLVRLDETCLKPTGKWGFNGSELVWRPENCVHNYDVESKQMVIFAGNSHIRNMFRCAVEMWRKTPMKNYTVSVEQQENKDFAVINSYNASHHVMTCDNQFPTHLRDYSHHESNIHLWMFWTVMWFIEDKYRQKCDPAPMISMHSSSTCLKDYEHFHSTYTGHRIGIEYIDSVLMETLKKSENSMLVINFNAQLNPTSAPDKLVEKLRALKITDRTLVVVDPTAGEDFDKMALKIFEANVRVLDLRQMYSAYEDATGKPAIINGHVIPPVQKVAVQLLKTVLASMSSLSS